MKGTGTGYGFPKLTELGGELEHAAMTSDRKRGEELVTEIEGYIDCVVLEYIS
jgi:hypothetical protein